MRVVVVLPQPPLPEGTASGRCAVALLRGLREHGVEVRAIAAGWRGASSAPPSDLQVEVHHVVPPIGRAAAARNLMHPDSALARSAFGARVRELAAWADVLHLEERPTGWCDGGATPALLHLHCLFHLDRDLPMPWHPGFLLALEHARADRLVARRHRFLVANSPVVADALRRLAPRAEITLVPLALDPAYYQLAPLDGPPVAGLLGTAWWPPTRRAVEQAVATVWPMVRRRVPDAVLRIAGRETESLGIDAPGVEVVGEVPSGAEFLRSLSVLLYPVPRGSGMKVKVLESLAVGLPVVTTPEGTEGVDGGEGVVVARTDDELAEATVRVLTDIDERRSRGREARRAFEARYTPALATEPLVRLYAAMSATRS